MAIDRRRFLKSGMLAGSALIASPYVFSTGARAAGEIKVGVEKGRVVTSGDITDLGDALVHRHMAV